MKEVLPPFGLGLLLFSSLLLLREITLLAGVLVSGGASLATVLRTLANLLPSIFAVTIPMGFLLGVLLGFGRLASESEIVALRACGVSPARLLRPVLLLAGAAALATFYVVALALPAANASVKQTYFALVIGKAHTSMKARVFSDDLLPGGQLVLYVSHASGDTWHDVFIHDHQDASRPALLLARSGRLVIDDLRRSVSLLLHDGVRYTFDRIDPRHDERLTFERHQLPLPAQAIFPEVSLSRGDRDMTIAELVTAFRAAQARDEPQRARRYRVELHKRFAIPVACLVFGLLGVALSLGARREARSAAFAVSIGVILVYYIGLRIGEQAGDGGTLPPALAVWSINVVMAAAAGLLLWRNQREAAFDPLDPGRLRLRIPAAWRPAAGARDGHPGTQRGATRSALRLLDRYVVRTYLGHLVLILAAFCAIQLVVELMDLLDDFRDNDVALQVVLRYYAYHFPAMVYQVAPMATLMATLTSFGVLSRRNEVTAMKSAGLSLYRVTAPALVLGALGAGALFFSNEFLLPYTNRMASRDFNVIKGRPPQSTRTLERRWIMGRDGRFYNHDFMDDKPVLQTGRSTRAPQGAITLLGLSVFDVDPESWTLRDYLHARRAAWNGVSYDLADGWRRTYRPQPAVRRFSQARSREIEPPDYFQRDVQDAQTLRFGELRAQITDLERQGLDVARLKVQLHAKLAFPLIAVVMTLISIPFAFVVAHRGALYGVGAALLIGIVYWTALGLFNALGANGLLAPLLAAWTPNLIFGAAGLYGLLRIDT